MAHSSSATVAAIACLLMLIGTAPSAAQFATPGDTPAPGAANGNTTALTSAKAVHQSTLSPELIRSVHNVRVLKLTREQAAAVAQLAASAPSPDADSAERGASFAPQRGGAVPVPQGQVG